MLRFFKLQGPHLIVLLYHIGAQGAGASSSAAGQKCTKLLQTLSN